MTDDRGAPDSDRVILHVDMDAFFASVELRDRPDLRGRPMMVGGTVRGVVVSATYEARAHGVRSGMPVSQARRLSPAAEVIAPRHDVYREVSAAVMATLDDITHLVEAASVDEAFLDITASIRRLGSPATIGQRLRARVAADHGITCTVGIAPTKLVAKMASTSAKPDGLRVVPPSRVLDFLHPLPVERLWGVGEATATRLHRFGLRTVGELAQTPVDTLVHTFGPHQGRHLADLAWGRDPRPVVSGERERSVGSSETFDTDTDDRTVIGTELLRMADRTASRLRRAGLMARTVAITIRYADFTTITRSATVASPTDSSADLHREAMTLFDRLGPLPRPVRLVGVRGESLVEKDRAHVQPTLDEPDVGWREAEAAMDQAVAKFGAGAVHRAALGRRPGR
ncbi:MAG TPA: DNA polymerase IV [Candidatus Avipropionibacterium avicola]|uniref:DNA polymerase IV n=1 Tax=Candidatus Avipropionibacterium avicola TaxID=2840701 RepID=A0A9D1KMN2_9ACTN|nr:DNA polymerase IV [Candidatus Avipropionibacterium avicola]